MRDDDLARRISEAVRREVALSDRKIAPDSGQPVKSAPLDQVLSIRISTNDLNRIRRAASRLGMTVPDYVRRSALPPELNYPLGQPISHAMGGGWPTTVTWTMPAGVSA